MIEKDDVYVGEFLINADYKKCQSGGAPKLFSVLLIRRRMFVSIRQGAYVQAAGDYIWLILFEK